MTKADIILLPGRSSSVERMHPWIFSGAIKRISEEVQDGDLVRVLDSKGDFLAIGHYYDGSISVKIITFEEEAIDDNFWENKLAAAFERRKWLHIFEQNHTNAFRLVHGEGDDLPGLIIDIYEDVLVLQAHSVGMYLSLPEISKAAQKVLGDRITAIYDKSKDCLPAQFAYPLQNGWLLGEKEHIAIKENDIHFHIDVVKGQKTGFFLDQRDNRALLGTYSKDKTVLNTFCYSGGFSLAALQAGATQVDSVDVSSNAIELVEKNLLLNEYFSDNHQSYVEDVMKFLRQEDVPQYDIVVLDPPAFAKSVSKRHNAVQGYKRLNMLGLEKVKPGGLLFTFSCSQVVDAPLFLNTVTAAAIECGRKVKVIHRLSQPADHPVNIFHPEGSYLKGLVLIVE
ncbi:MAG TPA: class I SAM-dependent rRNA methyltransferase [Chitinophagales bacterium]|nr:class I SAM-dependent rRNA methyltransferase [Chitinophagales bacterium]